MEPVEALAQHLCISTDEIQVWNDGSFTKESNDRVEYYVLDEEEKQAKMPDTWAHFETIIGEYYIYKV